MAYIKIIRPINCLFAMLTTLVGAFYLQSYIGKDLLILSVLAGITTFFVAAGGYVCNDYYDFAIDKINKPDRPIPKGDISLKNAKIYSFCLIVIGVITSFFIKNIYCISVAVLNSLTLYLYARYFKKSFLCGNIIVAWNACSTFLFGALISLNIKNIFPLICFSFLYTIIREWVKIIEDYDGDLKENVRSIAIVCGKTNTLRLMYIPSLLMAISIFVFYLLKIVSGEIFLVLNFFITFPLLIFLIILNKSLHIRVTKKIQNFMKLNMLSIVFIFIVNHAIEQVFEY